MDGSGSRVVVTVAVCDGLKAVGTDQEAGEKRRGKVIREGHVSRC